ncbi:MAG: DUF1440 domain-containing protein [Actinomycetota bacterium]|nr:DUF1440 domain-containing protein [Actinomycetota bacterium]
MPEADLESGSTMRAGVRGLVAAMSMTGMRTVTTNAGLLEKPPPETVMARRQPAWVEKMSPEHRGVLTELAHWAYGSMGGAAFGLLPARLRAHTWSGPMYGVAVWLGFELGVGPLFGLQHPREERLVGRAAVVLDHLLYGIVVAGRIGPKSKPSTT